MKGNAGDREALEGRTQGTETGLWGTPCGNHSAFLHNMNTKTEIMENSVSEECSRQLQMPGCPQGTELLHPQFTFVMEGSEPSVRDFKPAVIMATAGSLQ